MNIEIEMNNKMLGNLRRMQQIIVDARDMRKKQLIYVSSAETSNLNKHIYTVEPKLSLKDTTFDLDALLEKYMEDGYNE